MEIKIRSQSLPQRCEVCHQSDCFDAVDNHCSRCNQLQPAVKKTVAHPLEPLGDRETLKEIALGLLSIIRIFIAAISAFVFFGLVCGGGIMGDGYAFTLPETGLFIIGSGLLTLIMFLRPDRRTVWIALNDIIIAAMISAIFWPISAYFMTYHFQYMGKLYTLIISGFNVGLIIGFIWQWFKIGGNNDKAEKLIG